MGSMFIGTAIYASLVCHQQLNLSWFDYRCCRGTNGTEGNHRLLWRAFNSMNLSLETLEILLLHFITRHNIRQSIRHRPGFFFPGHYNPWITDTINRISTSIWGEPLYPDANSNNFDWDWTAFEELQDSYIIAPAFTDDDVHS